MAQSPVDTYWGQHGLDLTQILGELVTTLPPPRHEPPILQSTMVEISRVLSAWRAAERLLGDHVEASPERTQISAERDGLRAAYHRLFEERNRRREPSMQLQGYRWNAMEVTAVRAS